MEPVMPTAMTATAAQQHTLEQLGERLRNGREVLLGDHLTPADNAVVYEYGSVARKLRLLTDVIWLAGSNPELGPLQSDSAADEANLSRSWV